MPTSDTQGHQRPGPIAGDPNPLIRGVESAVLGFIAQHAPGQDAHIRSIARAFGVPVGTAQRNLPYFQKQLRLNQVGAAFRAASATRAWIGEKAQNLTHAAGQVPQLVYLENTVRHARASLIHSGAAVVGGAGRLADAAHDLHRRLDSMSQLTGRDMTPEGQMMAEGREHWIASQPPTQRAAAARQPEWRYADVTTPLANRGKAFAKSIDIAHPDRFQRIVGDVAGAAPGVGVGLLNPVAGAAVFATQGADAAYDDAVAHGADRRTAQSAAAINGLVDGGLSLIPGEKLLGRYLKTPAVGALKTARAYVDKALATGGLTGGMTVAENAVARGLGFDPERPLLQGAPESFGEGALLGSLFHAGRQAMAPPRAPASPRPLDIAVEAARDTPLVRDAPAHARPLLKRMAPQVRVRIPASHVHDYVGTLSPPEAARFLDETGIGVQLGPEPAALHEVETDLAAYLGVVARDEGPGAFPGAHEAVGGQARLVAAEPEPDAAPGDPSGEGEYLAPEAAPSPEPPQPVESETTAPDPAVSRLAAAEEVGTTTPPSTADAGPPAEVSAGPADVPPSTDRPEPIRPDAGDETSHLIDDFGPTPTEAAPPAPDPIDANPYEGLSKEARDHIVPALARWAITGEGPDLGPVLLGPARASAPPIGDFPSEAVFRFGEPDPKSEEAVGGGDDPEFVGPVIGKSGFKSPTEFAEALRERYQVYVDESYAAALAAEGRGLLRGLKSTRLGAFMDRRSAWRLKQWLASENILEGPNKLVEIDRRLPDPGGSGQFVRPDVRIRPARVIYDATIASKWGPSEQIRRFIQFSGGDRVTLIRPPVSRGSVSGSYSPMPREK